MLNIIDLSNRNRYGHKIWLQQEDGNGELFSVHTEEEWLLKYAQFSYDSLPKDSTFFDDEINGQKEKLYSFDVDGGPFIEVGKEKLNGKTLKRIFFRENVLLFQYK